MVKGYKRQVVVLRGTDRDSFTEAYFLLKEASGEKNHSDLVAEANRILADCKCEDTGRGRTASHREIGWFFCGVGSTLAIVSVVLALL